MVPRRLIPTPPRLTAAPEKQKRYRQSANIPRRRVKTGRQFPKMAFGVNTKNTQESRLLRRDILFLAATQPFYPTRLYKALW